MSSDNSKAALGVDFHAVRDIEDTMQKVCVDWGDVFVRVANPKPAPTIPATSPHMQAVQEEYDFITVPIVHPRYTATRYTTLHTRSHSSPHSQQNLSLKLCTVFDEMMLASQTSERDVSHVRHTQCCCQPADLHQPHHILLHTTRL